MQIALSELSSSVANAVTRIMENAKENLRKQVRMEHTIHEPLCSLSFLDVIQYHSIACHSTSKEPPLPCLLCHACTSCCMFHVSSPCTTMYWYKNIRQTCTVNTTFNCLLVLFAPLCFCLCVCRSVWIPSNRRTETVTDKAARTRSMVRSGAREAKTILIWSPSFKRWVGEWMGDLS